MSSSSSSSPTDDDSDWLNFKSQDSESQDDMLFKNNNRLHETLPTSNSFFARSVALSSQNTSPGLFLKRSISKLPSASTPAKRKLPTEDEKNETIADDISQVEGFCPTNCKKA